MLIVVSSLATGSPNMKMLPQKGLISKFEAQDAHCGTTMDIFTYDSRKSAKVLRVDSVQKEDFVLYLFKKLLNLTRLTSFYEFNTQIPVRRYVPVSGNVYSFINIRLYVVCSLIYIQRHVYCVKAHKLLINIIIIIN